MKLRQLIAIAALAAVAACSQGAGALPGQTPQTQSVTTAPRTIQCAARGCSNWQATTLYGIRGAAYYPPFPTPPQGLSVFNALASGATSSYNGTQTFANPPSSVPNGPTELYRDQSGNFWYIASESTGNALVECSWDGYLGDPCTQGGLAPLGPTNPTSFTIDRTGRLAVINGDGSILVYAPGSTAFSAPTNAIPASDYGLNGTGPRHVAFDPGGNLWVSDFSNHVTGGGQLFEYALGANGSYTQRAEIFPNQTALTDGFAGCPIAINRFSQLWSVCETTDQTTRIYNVNLATQAITALVYFGNPASPGAPFIPGQVAVDDVSVYVSDNKSTILSFPNTTQSFPNGGPQRILALPSSVGGIALQ